MNILFIGPYRQNDEWGRKSRSVLNILKKTDHSVTSRPLYLANNSNHNMYTETSELIIKNNYDVLIQFLLQPYATYKGNIAKKIGIFNTETIPYYMPLGQLRTELLMDEIWIDNVTIKDNLQKILKKHNSNTKLVVTPPILDIENLPAHTSNSLRESDANLKNRFIFYYIGNILDDKAGFKEACVAYLNTFTKKDPVILLIGIEAILPAEQINTIINKCKDVVKRAKPLHIQPEITIISPQYGILTTEERVSIHIDGDCMISTDYAVSTNSIALEAMLYNSTPIINKGNASYEWFGEDNLWGVESYEEYCIYEETHQSSLYRFTSGESWYKPIVKSLSEVMRNVYINKFERDKKIAANNKLREYFKNASYANILNGEPQ